jgi:hypothetical protein
MFDELAPARYRRARTIPVKHNGRPRSELAATFAPTVTPLDSNRKTGKGEG